MGVIPSFARRGSILGASLDTMTGLQFTSDGSVGIESQLRCVGNF